MNNQKKPETGLYKTADIISKQSGNNLCFINYSAENILNGTDVIDDTDGTNTIKFAYSTLEDVIVSVYGTNDAVMYSTTNGNMILLENFRDIEGNELKLKFKDSEEMTA